MNFNLGFNLFKCKCSFLIHVSVKLAHPLYAKVICDNNVNFLSTAANEELRRRNLQELQHRVLFDSSNRRAGYQIHKKLAKSMTQTYPDNNVVDSSETPTGKSQGR